MGRKLIACLQLSAFEIDTSIKHLIFNRLIFAFFGSFQVKIWFQNHRYKCKRQAKEKAMAEQNQHNQVNIFEIVLRNENN